MKSLIPDLLLLTGCATTLNRPQETISVDSQPVNEKLEPNH